VEFTVTPEVLALVSGLMLLTLVGGLLKARSQTIVFALAPAAVYVTGGTASLIGESAAAAAVAMLLGVGVVKLVNSST
jgi:hypothetical protein